MIDKYGQYDISVSETHHTQKLDKPSGTAIRIAEYIIDNMKRKGSFVNDSENPLEYEINILSKRIDGAVGRHEIEFSSKSDSISLVHNAKSRQGFAEGALLAAKYIHGKKGFFKFEDIFNNLSK